MGELSFSLRPKGEKVIFLFLYKILLQDELEVAGQAFLFLVYGLCCQAAFILCKTEMCRMFHRRVMYRVLVKIYCLKL